MRKINAMFFKESGKFYAEQILEVPEELQVSQICDGIKSGKLAPHYKDMPYVIITGNDPNDSIMYPHLINRGS